MKCPQCNAHIKDDSAYCIICGSRTEIALRDDAQIVPALEGMPNPWLFEISSYMKGQGLRMGETFGYPFLYVYAVVIAAVLLRNILHPLIILPIFIFSKISYLFLPWYLAKRAILKLHGVNIRVSGFRLFLRHFIGGQVFMTISLLLLSPIAYIPHAMGLIPHLNEATQAGIFIVTILFLQFVFGIFWGGWIVYGHLSDLKRKGKLATSFDINNTNVTAT